MNFRQTLIQKYIQKWKIQNGDYLLEIGCMTGDISSGIALCNPNCCVVGVDTSDSNINNAREIHQRENVFYRTMALSEISADISWRGLYDHIFSIAEFHWLSDYDKLKVLQSCHHCLNQNGTLHLITLGKLQPRCAAWKSFHRTIKQYPHIIEIIESCPIYPWDINTVKTALDQCGYQIIDCYIDIAKITFENNSDFINFLRSLDEFRIYTNILSEDDQIIFYELYINNYNKLASDKNVFEFPCLIVNANIDSL